MEVMEANERIAKPFKNLTELYKEIDQLTYWPAILDLRKSTDYVYRGTDISTFVDRPPKLRRKDVPKTIVCHDFMGGYLEDKYLDGSNEHNSYHFYHWSVIDTFIYFSHNFVTIPPFGWINAAHRHGVKVLGTVITESASGRLLLDEFLNTRESIKKFANALVQIAQFYKFEGWLLNIENEVAVDDVPKLTFFVQYLTERIHERIEGSEIIWYDSVTNTGKLDWQNELNEKNEIYFNECDGIFLNYNWTDSTLENSAMKVRKTNRIHDIYVGLDVWGRGCPGGGGFNSAFALQKIRAQGLSAAIFAPGWTFEFFGPNTFPRVENIYWAQLMQYLYIHVPMYAKERFITSFCRGAGRKYYEYGMQITYQDPVTHNVVESNSSFYNMAMQKHQTVAFCQHLKFISMNIVPPLVKDEKSTPVPQECTYETTHEIIRVLDKVINFEEKPDSYNGINCLQFSYDISYEGGGCLKLINRNVHSYHRLFFIDIEFTREVQARVVYKIDDSDPYNLDQDNNLVLLLGSSNGLTSFLPRDTLQYGAGWKMSVYQTSMNKVYEMGVAMTKVGSCYIGKIVLDEVKHPRRR